jgi:hypothetical protein
MDGPLSSGAAAGAGIETVALMARGALDEAQKPQVMQRRQALFEGAL